MRRLLAFVMCCSGFTLAVSWSRGDEPASAAATEGQQPLAEGAVESSVRPEVVPLPPSADQEAAAGDTPAAAASDEAGADRRDRLDNARLKNWLRLYDHQTANGSAGAFVEQLIRQLGQLEERMERLPDRLENLFQGEALEQAQQKIQLQQAEAQRQIALIERFLNAVDERKAIAANRATDQLQTAAAESESPRASDGPPATEHERRRSERAPEAQAERPDSATRDRIAQRLEQELARLRGMAAEVQDSAADEAEGVRQEVERQIDAVERFLAERRRHRDAVRDRMPASPAIAGAADGSPEVARFRHLRAAIEHLEAAGMGEIAASLRPHAENLQHEIERQLSESGRRSTRRQPAEAEGQMADQGREEPNRQAQAEAESNALPTEVRKLAEQVRELRRDLRRLRAEVGEIRQAGGERPEE